VTDLPDVPGLPERPPPPRPLAERVRTWVEWVGPARIVGSALVVLAVLAAAYWLVKPPAATTESTLPFAHSSTTAGSQQTGNVAGTPPTSLAVAVTTTSGEVVVHVAGAVTSPGVYRLPVGSRVVDSVQSAGGLTSDALPDAVNLAALLTDGERIYVPRVGETVPVTAAEAAGSTAAPGPIDINRASADELDSLPGVGPATAAAIVAHRDQYGPFGSIDDLADVRGIGPAKLEVLRGLVTT
jgi:competence protein ComEA